MMKRKIKWTSFLQRLNIVKNVSVLNKLMHNDQRMVRKINARPREREKLLRTRDQISQVKEKSYELRIRFQNKYLQLDDVKENMKNLNDN